ncbi:MAG TPA: pectin acetylesterase-family hydrolase [Polyangiales bacterium]|nr:pectin acetylesterase-family hydrolase [Polyangiales bacterium]
MFELENANNPFKGWSQVWIPYCTGDVYAGTRSNVTIEGVATPQSFYGNDDVKKTIGRMKATFPEITRFVAGGSSAGGYGAGIHFGNLQDTFRGALGSALLDASPPFTNDYAAVCMQQRWRDTWGVDGAFPSDCGTTCRDAKGGNLFQIVDYWRAKYPSAKVALISGIHDEIIRLFFSLGNDDCAGYQGDPVSLFLGTLGDTYPPDKFSMGLSQLRTKYEDTDQLATYFMDGLPNGTAHQCLFRSRLYEKAAGADKPTIAEFLKTWIEGTMTQVGP